MLALGIDTTAAKIYQDPSKPPGDACNVDGTLKSADEIDFVNSPSDEQPPKSISTAEKRKAASVGPDSSDTDGALEALTKKRVCDTS